MNCNASERSHPFSLAAPEVMRMAKNVKVTGQEQNHENNQEACGHENPLVFIGHNLRFSQNLVCVNWIIGRGYVKGLVPGMNQRILLKGTGYRESYRASTAEASMLRAWVCRFRCWPAAAGETAR